MVVIFQARSSPELLFARILLFYSQINGRIFSMLAKYCSQMIFSSLQVCRKQFFVANFLFMRAFYGLATKKKNLCVFFHLSYQLSHPSQASLHVGATSFHSTFFFCKLIFRKFQFCPKNIICLPTKLSGILFKVLIEKTHKAKKILS